MSWKFESLDNLGVITTGSTPSTTDQSFWEGDIPFVTPADLDKDDPITKTPRTISKKGAGNARILNEGAILICCIGSLGKIGMAGCSLVTNQQINSIEFDSKRVFPRYGFYACKTLKRKLETIAPATTVPIVNKSKFGQLVIPLPPLPEQRRIAAILDQADALRAKRREALAQLDKLTQSIFIEMFGEISLNTALGNICEFSQGIQIPIENQETKQLEGYIRFLRITDYTQGDEHRYISHPGNRYKVEIDDIAIVRYGASAGFVCFGKSGVIANNLFKLNFNKSEVLPTYLYHCLNTNRFKAFIEQNAFGAAMPALNFKMMNDYPIAIPPSELQYRFKTLIDKIESQKTLFHFQITELDNLFASLQHRAFRGEL